MRYIIANKKKAEQAGLVLAGCRVKGENVIINEKSLGVMPGSSTEEKIDVLGGKAYSQYEIKVIIKNNNW